MIELVKTSIFNFTQSINGGECFCLITEYHKNEDNSIFTNQKFVLNSYAQSASINIYSFCIDNIKINKLKQEILSCKSARKDLRFYLGDSTGSDSLFVTANFKNNTFENIKLNFQSSYNSVTFNIDDGFLNIKNLEEFSELFLKNKESCLIDGKT